MIYTLFFGLLILLALGVPIFIGLSGSVIVSFALFNDIDLIVIIQRFIAGINKFSLLSIPLFILAANVMSEGGISKRIIKVANVFVGRIPGGLGMTVILSCMFFGAISGSAPATVVAIGGLMYHALLEKKYPVNYATGVITTSGSLGIIIPPSVTMIVYGTVTGCSVGTLFIAGIGAGVLYGLLFMIYTFFFARKNKDVIVSEEKSTLKEKLFAIKDAAWGLGVPIIILGGIYGGVFTPTEAAAVSAVYALIIARFVYREMKLKEIIKCIYRSAITTVQIMILIAGASVFSWILTSEGVTVGLANTMLAISNNPKVLFLMFNIIFLIAGMFIDGAGMVTILVPLIYPIALNAGIDIIHLGIVLTINCAIGMFTPPFGLNLFVASSITKQPILKIAKGSLPFLGMSLIALVLITYFPEISLWLPRTIYGAW